MQSKSFLGVFFCFQVHRAIFKAIVYFRWFLNMRRKLSNTFACLISALFWPRAFWSGHRIWLPKFSYVFFRVLQEGKKFPISKSAKILGISPIFWLCGFQYLALPKAGPAKVLPVCSKGQKKSCQIFSKLFFYLLISYKNIPNMSKMSKNYNEKWVQ